MQFEDPKSVLEAAAAKPSHGIDPQVLLRKGARMRRARLAAAASGVAVVVAAASASFGMLADGRGDDRPGPAAPSPGRCAESSQVSMFLRDDVDAGAARDLERMLDRVLRDLNEAYDVEYVSKRQAYRQALRLDDDREWPWELQPSEVPARLDFLGVDEATIERLHQTLRGEVEAIGRRTATTGRDGTCVEVVEGEPPPRTPTRTPRGEATGRVRVEVLRADCATGTIHLENGGSADFVDGSRWCTFALLVNNRSDRSIRLDMGHQVLRGARGRGFAPWEDAMFGDVRTRLFSSPIPPDRRRMGEVVFLLPPTPVPAALELHPGPGFAPVSVPLEYDCPTDLRDAPGRRCMFSTGDALQTFVHTQARATVALYHCGIEPLRFGGKQWVVPDPPFDATNAPEDFTGHGVFKQRSGVDALYVDDSGEVVRFEASEDWEPPPCA